MQTPTTPSEKSASALGGSSQVTEEELHPPLIEPQRESMGQRPKARTDSGDQQDSQQGTHRSNSNSGGTPSEQPMRPVQPGWWRGELLEFLARELLFVRSIELNGVGPTMADDPASKQACYNVVKTVFRGLL